MSKRLLVQSGDDAVTSDDNNDTVDNSIRRRTARENARQTALIMLAASTTPFDVGTLQQLLDHVEHDDIKSLCSVSPLTRANCLKLERARYWEARIKHECLVVPPSKPSFFLKYMAGAPVSYSGQMSRLTLRRYRSNRLTIEAIMPQCDHHLRFSVNLPDRLELENFVKSIHDLDTAVDGTAFFTVDNVVRTAFQTDEKPVGYTSHAPEGDASATAVLTNRGHILVNASDRVRGRTVKMSETSFTLPNEAIVSCNTVDHYSVGRIIARSAIALTASGRVYIFGLEGERARRDPVRIEFEEATIHIIAIATLRGSCCMLDRDGSVFAYWITGEVENPLSPFTPLEPYKFVGYYRPQSDDERAISISADSFVTKSGIICMFVIFFGYDRTNAAVSDLRLGNQYDSRITIAHTAFAGVRKIQSYNRHLLAIDSNGDVFYGLFLSSARLPIIDAYGFRHVIDSSDMRFVRLEGARNCIDCAIVQFASILSETYLLTLSRDGTVCLFSIINNVVVRTTSVSYNDQ